MRCPLLMISVQTGQIPISSRDEKEAQVLSSLFRIITLRSSHDNVEAMRSQTMPMVHSGHEVWLEQNACIEISQRKRITKSGAICCEISFKVGAILHILSSGGIPINPIKTKHEPPYQMVSVPVVQHRKGLANDAFEA